MRAHCIVAIFAFLTPLSFALISVGTPETAVACAAVQLSWQGGIGPWRLRILSGSAPNNALENLGTTTVPSFTWTVNANPGTTVILSVQDSVEDSGQSLPFGIHATPLGCAASPPSGVGDPSPPIATFPNDSGNNKGVSTSATNGDGGGTSGTGTSTSASSAQGGSQATDPSTASQQSSDSSSIDSGQDSSPTLSPASSSGSFTQSSPSAAAFNFNSGSSSSRSDATNSLSSPSFTLSDTFGGQGGPILPATTVLSQSGVSSSGTDQASGSNSNFAKKNVMSGSIIGGIIAAVLCVLLAAFCVIRRCRRRRSNSPDTLSYPFSISDTEASAPREMVGRSGYPASTFSSWGNHGDLDERVLSPTTGAGSTEGLPMWEAGQGTIESRYQAAFTPGHTASSSSIDRNDPSSHHRFRGPIPKSMTDTYRAGPPSSSTAIMREQPYTADPNDSHPAQGFDEIRPQAMPSRGAIHDMMTGRHPVVAGYPPPYTSK